MSETPLQLEPPKMVFSNLTGLAILNGESPLELDVTPLRHPTLRMQLSKMEKSLVWIPTPNFEEVRLAEEPNLWSTEDIRRELFKLQNLKLTTGTSGKAAPKKGRIKKLQTEMEFEDIMSKVRAYNKEHPNESENGPKNEE